MITHAAEAPPQIADQYQAWIGYAVDAAWLTAPVAAYMMEIERVLGVLIAAVIALAALGAACYRFQYWRAKAKREIAAMKREMGESP